MAALSDKAATPDAKCRQLAASAVPASADWLAVTPPIKFGAAGQTFPLPSGNPAVPVAARLKIMRR
jgi:hypothetical protein